MNNFNTAMELVAGINSMAVERLKKTWAKVPSVGVFISPFCFFSVFLCSWSRALWLLGINIVLVSERDQEPQAT